MVMLSHPHPFPIPFLYLFPFRKSHCLSFAPYLDFQRRLTSPHRIRTASSSFFSRSTPPNRISVEIDGATRLGFRLSTRLRPENDIRNIRLSVKTSKVPSSQLGSAAIPSEYNALFESLQKEIRSGRPVFDIGESMVNDALASIPNVTTIKLIIWPEMIYAPDQKYAILQVEKNELPEYKKRGHCPCRFSSAWSFKTKMNPVGSTVEVEIQTTKTRNADAETAHDSGWEKQFPQESETAESRSAAKDSMHGVHQALVDRLKETQNFYSQVLASQLCELAFLLSDKTFKGSRLTSVSIGISTHQIGLDGAHFAPMKLRSELNRSRYENCRPYPARKSIAPKDHRVYVALGSNVGDRIAMLDLACCELDRSGIRVVRTSALYETEPMYLQNQPSFVNGACEVQTILKPFDLLDKLKEIENALGRQKTVENGPRNIDLDILLYDDIYLDHERLTIPHKRILEREFVLRPLCDLIPEATLPLPLNSATFSTELFKLPKPESPLSPLTPLSPNVAPISSLSSTRTTHIMAILNLTPDSFSDGNVHPKDPKSLLPTLEEFLSAGVSIIDIGGQSTRPHAPQITAEEEISRVLPAIKFIRSQPAFDKMAISIDTYRASVADAAIAAGANIVNDISAGQMDSRMLPKIAELGCSVIMMHMRGTPETMTTLTNYPSGVLKGVGSELLKRVAEAEQAGIRRWRIMLDPGIGFAKNEGQNLELLRHFANLRQYRGLQGLPWVVGASRKQFIGRITGVQTPSLRSWGTATTVTAAIQGGADIVRVHDAVQMAQVAKMADAIWRV